MHRNCVHCSVPRTDNKSDCKNQKGPCIEHTVSYKLAIQRCFLHSPMLELTAALGYSKQSLELHEILP